MTTHEKGAPMPSERPTNDSTNVLSVPYTAFYSQRLRASIRHMSEVELRIFVLLSTYANDEGICWPGIRELSEQSGYRQEDVIAALECLEAGGYMVFLRRAQRDPLTRHMTSNVYAINPLLLKCSNPTSDPRKFAVMERLQDSSAFWSHKQHHINQHQEAAPDNQHQKAPPPTNQTSEGGEQPQDHYANSASRPAANVGGYAAGNANAHERTPRTAKTVSERSATQQRRKAQPQPSPSSAPPPPDLAVYNVPLADELAEQWADRLRTKTGNMSAPNARQLVDTYGTRRVASVLHMLAKQPAGEVENPAGYVIWQLRKSAVDPDKDTAQSDAATRFSDTNFYDLPTESEAQNGHKD